MLRKVLSFVGPTIELEDAAIFGAFALGIMPEIIFKPTIATIGLASFLKPFAEQPCSAKQGLGVLGWIPGGLAVSAGFFLEGAAVPTFFTAALVSGLAVFSGEVVYKYCTDKEFSSKDTWECFIKGLKTAGMVASLQIGGSGNIVERLKGGIPILWSQAVPAAGASVLSLRNAWKGYAAFFKPVCCEEEKKPLNPGYKPLDEIQITEYQQIALTR